MTLAKCKSSSVNQQNTLKRSKSSPGQLGKRSGFVPTHVSHTETRSEAGRCLPQEPPSLPALTGAGEDVGVLLVGAQQAHELGGLRVVQREQADVILGGAEGVQPRQPLSEGGSWPPTPGLPHSPTAQDYDLRSPRASQRGPTMYRPSHYSPPSPEKSRCISISPWHP